MARTTTHNLTNKYRPARMAGCKVYDHKTWIYVETSAGRDWEGSCYSNMRGMIARCATGGWLAITWDIAKDCYGTEAEEKATWYPTMLRAYSHIRPVAKRRKDFSR